MYIFSKMRRINWIFNKRIEFGGASDLYPKLKRMKGCKIIIDLTETQYIHSSFIGFLIYLKTQLDNLRIILNLQISEKTKKILKNKNLLEYFREELNV